MGANPSPLPAKKWASHCRRPVFFIRHARTAPPIPPKSNPKLTSMWFRCVFDSVTIELQSRSLHAAQKALFRTTGFDQLSHVYQIQYTVYQAGYIRVSDLIHATFRRPTTAARILSLSANIAGVPLAYRFNTGSSSQVPGRSHCPFPGKSSGVRMALSGALSKPFCLAISHQGH